MKKVLVAQFGGTPSRAGLCLFMNCAAGVFENMDITIYPFDKDTRSPNYTNSRKYHEEYQTLYKTSDHQRFAKVTVNWQEDMFNSLLEKAGIDSSKESIVTMMRDGKNLNDRDWDILYSCFTHEELMQELEGGYYGKANIGAVTSQILVYKKIYNEIAMIKDIDAYTKEGQNSVDVCIVCSSFGGTGASLGTNFGEFLADYFCDKRDKVKIHCIHIQPYFSFPSPALDDEWQVKCDEFYAKSAAVTAIYAGKTKFIKNADKDETCVFDSFYYIGQEFLDKISDSNIAKDNQTNKLHITDMLVSLAIRHAVEESQEKKSESQLYGYLYSADGTDTISWNNMPLFPKFRNLMVTFARFSAFMVDVVAPLLSLGAEKYRSEALIVLLYGHKVFSNEAIIKEDLDADFRNVLKTCIAFCENYLKYWAEIEETTRYGQEDKTVTRFFNQTELKRVLDQENKLLEGSREMLDLDQITKLGEAGDYHTGITAKYVYDQLSHDRRLLKFADKHTGVGMARSLLTRLYELCVVDDKREEH